MMSSAAKDRFQRARADSDTLGTWQNLKRFMEVLPSQLESLPAEILLAIMEYTAIECPTSLVSLGACSMRLNGVYRFYGTRILDELYERESKSSDHLWAALVLVNQRDMRSFFVGEISMQTFRRWRNKGSNSMYRLLRVASEHLQTQRPTSTMKRRALLLHRKATELATYTRDILLKSGNICTCKTCRHETEIEFDYWMHMAYSYLTGRYVGSLYRLKRLQERPSSNQKRHKIIKRFPTGQRDCIALTRSDDGGTDNTNLEGIRIEYIDPIDITAIVLNPFNVLLDANQMPSYVAGAAIEFLGNEKDALSCWKLFVQELRLNLERCLKLSDILHICRNTVTDDAAATDSFVHRWIQEHFKHYPEVWKSRNQQLARFYPAWGRFIRKEYGEHAGPYMAAFHGGKDASGMFRACLATGVPIRTLKTLSPSSLARYRELCRLDQLQEEKRESNMYLELAADRGII